jgi:hypothetical protein
MLSEIGTRLEQDLSTARVQFNLSLEKCAGLHVQLLQLEKELENILKSTKLLATELLCPETSTERSLAINVDLDNRYIDIDVIRQQIETIQITHNTALQDNAMLCERVLDIMEQLEEHCEEVCVFKKPTRFLQCETIY